MQNLAISCRTFQSLAKNVVVASDFYDWANTVNLCAALMTESLFSLVSSHEDYYHTELSGQWWHQIVFLHT